MTHGSKAYEVVLYHDEPGEAAVDSRSLCTYPARQADAIALAQRSLTDHWQTATVHEGRMVRRNVELGVSLDLFEDGNRLRWYVGPDYAEREVTA